MKKNFAVIYGSAVTKMFADGMKFPRDIDIMTNMDHVLVGTMALRWFERAYPEHPDPKKIPLDFHDPEIFSGSIKIPMIQDGWKTPKTPYHVLFSEDGLKIEAYIRENGVASLLRLHGNTPIAFADKIRKSPEGMSIMPGDNYYSPDRPDMDKYYSGLQATRNAWAHVKLENRDAIIQCLNCGNLFTRLMEEDLTLKEVNDKENHQILLYGLGDQHLDVVKSKLADRYKVEIEFTKPRIAYKETIRGKVTSQGKYKKQSGGHGQYGDVKMEFAPSGDLETPYIFEEKKKLQLHIL